MLDPLPLGIPRLVDQLQLHVRPVHVLEPEPGALRAGQRLVLRVRNRLPDGLAPAVTDVQFHVRVMHLFEPEPIVLRAELTGSAAERSEARARGKGIGGWVWWRGSLAEPWLAAALQS